MRVLDFGTYERDYPRNAQVISALRGAGVGVIERHVAIWEGREHKFAAGAGAAARIAVAEARLLRRPSGRFDVVLVGYPGQFDLPAARRAARARPVVFNALVSLWDTLVERPPALRPRLPRGAGAPGAGPRRLPRRRSCRRRHEGERRPLPRAGCAPRRSLPRRRGGAHLPPGLDGGRPVSVRRQADPAPRTRHDPCGGEAQRPSSSCTSSAAASSTGYSTVRRRTCAARSGSTTNTYRESSTEPERHSASSVSPPRRPG